MGIKARIPAILRTRAGLALAALAAVSAGLGFMLSDGYSPPVVTDADRIEALGSFSPSEAWLARALPSPEDFEPVPPPAPGDWLESHPEYGQTYAAFSHGYYHRPDAVRNRIYLQPIGLTLGDKKAFLAAIRKFTAAFFGLRTAVLPEISLDEVEARSRVNGHTGQRQVRTGDIMKALKREIPADAFCVLGITMEDLYPGPSWNYVSGYSSYRGRTGVYSFFRFSAGFLGAGDTPDFRKGFLLRSEKLIAHEISHMFGLRHCIYYSCLMNGVNNTAELDSHPLRLCPVCLRKLQSAAGFDIKARYAALEALYREQAASEEASWTHKRLAKIGEGPH